MKVKLNLFRKKDSGLQTIGVMDVFLGKEYVTSLHTLEQEWNNNATDNSCIPKGEYQVILHDSPTHGECLLVLGTDPRADILFHVGNYYFNSKGCILVGLYHSDINSDGNLDVVNSGKAFGILMDVCRKADEILLSIS